MTSLARTLSEALAHRAESVCRAYLPHGRKSGGYWCVGDVSGKRGKSLYVRLHISDRGAAGQWSDAATGEHGDLLDLIRLNRGHREWRETFAEASAFLGQTSHVEKAEPPPDRTAMARKLWSRARPIDGTLAVTYLAARGLPVPPSPSPLRYLARCLYRGEDGAPFEEWPALLAAVTDENGEVTGVHRTYLARDGSGKAPVAVPRRALGRLYPHGVRFGEPGLWLGAGEGLETVLSIGCVMEGLPLIACLSAEHLAGLALPSTLRTLFIVVDRDAAGFLAAWRLAATARAAGIEARLVVPHAQDFNDDLRTFGQHGVSHRLASQLSRFEARLFLRTG